MRATVVVDNQRVADVAARVLIGPPDGTVPATGDADFWRPNRGVLRCTGASPRTYPPDADGAGYTYWSVGCFIPSLELCLSFTCYLSQAS